MDELKDCGPFKSISSSKSTVPKGERVLVCGGEGGEIVILRSKH